MHETLTERERAKADRRAAILSAATALFAERGYAGVTIEELGQAAGVSGPAVYRHFPGKAAVLAAILEDASRTLLAGADEVIARTDDPAAALAELVAFHVDFAVADADVILVQDRELERLEPEVRHEVRRVQRAYVERWVEVLGRLMPALGERERRVRAHAAFGLMNSTPHSARIGGVRPRAAEVRRILAPMALAALTAPVPVVE